MTQDLTVGKPISRIWQFAVPVLFGLLLQQVYSLVDTAIVGHALGVMALGGVGATGSVNFLVLGFCGGLCTGMAIPLAQAFGAGEYRQLRRYVAGCVWLGLIMSAVLLAVTLPGTRGLLGLGVAGAAIATVVSQLGSGLLCVGYLKKHFPILRMEKDDWKLRRPEVMRLLGMGVPVGLQFSITAIGSVMLQSAVNSLGAVCVSGVAVAGKIYMLLACPFDALAMAATNFTGQNLGAGKYDRIRQGTYACLFIGILYCVLYILIAQFGTRYLSLLFMNADEAASVMSYTQQLNVAYAYATPLLLGVNVLRLSIQGMGYSRLSLISGLLEMLARTAVSLWAVPAFGFDAACLASPLAWLLADCFLVPGFYGCLNARRRQAARVRKELPEE